jgi:hypothetical protein
MRVREAAACARHPRPRVLDAPQNAAAARLAGLLGEVLQSAEAWTLHQGCGCGFGSRIGWQPQRWGAILRYCVTTHTRLRPTGHAVEGLKLSSEVALVRDQSLAL